MWDKAATEGWVGAVSLVVVIKCRDGDVLFEISEFITIRHGIGKCQIHYYLAF